MAPCTWTLVRRGLVEVGPGMLYIVAWDYGQVVKHGFKKQTNKSLKPKLKEKHPKKVEILTSPLKNRADFEVACGFLG